LEKILVTGATGQIGVELVPELRKLFGNENVIGCWHKRKPTEILKQGPLENLTILDKNALEEVVKKHDVKKIFHLAAVLSATGEQKPQLAFDVNINGTFNVLEVGRKFELKQIMIPSSMAAFGPDTPKENTPNETLLRPTTMYGITKVAGELLGNYYFQKFGLDVRGVRYPGILSSEAEPTAGTTDYSTAIFYDGIKKGEYECFLKEDTTLPMMYMPDAIKALIDLSNAPLEKLKHHADFNVAAMSFNPGQITEELKKYLPELKVTYKPDFRQEIADSWPDSLDDSAAREEWGWKPDYDLPKMVKDLFEKLSKRLK